MTAVPPSFLYRVGRFVRHRRTAVAVGAALSVLVLLTAAVMIRGTVRERRHQAQLQAERASAAQQAALAQQATAQVQDMASELDEALSQRRLEEVTKLLERQLDATADVAQAGALLARTIRENPKDVRATYRLMALLSQRDFARPLAEKVFEREVVGLAWTRHGLVAAVRDGDPQAIHRPVALVRFETGNVVLRPLGEERGFREFKFIAEGRLFWVTRLAQERPHEQLWICDSSTGKAVGPPISLPGQVYLVVPETTEQRVAIGVSARGTAGQTRSLRVYDLHAGQLIGQPLAYGSGGMSARVRFEAGGHRVLIPALGMQERSRLWNVESGKVSELPPGLSPLAVSDGVADEPRRGEAEQLRRPDWLPGSAITLPNAIREVTRAAFAPDGQRLATLGADNRRVRLWDVTTTAMRPVEVFNPGWRDPQPPGSAPEIDAVGRRVLRSFGTNLVVRDKGGRWSVGPNTAGSNLVVWDLANGNPLASWDLAPTKTERVHLSPDGDWVLLVGAGQARLCAAADGHARSAFGATGTQRVADGAFTPDGSRVLTWTETGSGQVWRMEPWAAVGSFGPHGARDVCVSVSPDSRRAATVASDAQVRIWDLGTGKEIAAPLKHSAAVIALDWAEAGEVLVTGAQDGNARVWDLRTGRLRGTPLRHGSPVTRLIVLDPSNHLVTAGEGQPAKLWNLRSGAFVRALQPGAGYFGPTEVRRTSGGTLLFVAGGESRVYDPTSWLPLSDRVPIESDPLDAPLAVSRNGAAVAGFLGLRMTALALPEVPGPAPAWLAELAEAIVGRRLTEQGGVVSYSFAESRQVFDRLRAIEGTDAYSCWLRWYLAVGPDRPLHPGTRVTQGEVVRRVAHSAELPALNRGLEFAPLHPVLQQARAEIASERLATTLARPADSPADAARQRRFGILAGQEMTDFLADDGLRLAQHILRLVPQSEAARKLSALSYAVLRQTNAAVQALGQVRTAPNKGYEWFLRGYVLEAAGDAAGAARAYAEASTLQPATFFRARPYDKAAVLSGAALPRDPAATAAQIDLTKFYNAGFGEACRGADARNNLGNLPAGLQVFDRIRFDARGIVQLAREASAQAQGRQFPDRVRDIPLRQKARRLHFLHGTGWTMEEGVEVGRYIIHYADGKTEALPLLYGRDLRDWWVVGSPGPAANAAVAWAGLTPGGQRVCLYHRVWENPFPDQELASLDFLSTQTWCAPFLIAVTAEP